MKGWRGGKIVHESVLRRLSNRLSRNNVSIITNDWATGVLNKTGAAAQFVRFKDGSAGILLQPNATRYQVLHELKHYEHWLSNKIQYGLLNRLEREEFVFRALRENHHWKRFMDAERQHAYDHVGYFRCLFEQ